MPRRITDEQELLDFINNRPSKKKKMMTAIVLIVLAAAFVLFIGIKMHEASVFNSNVEAANAALESGNYAEAVEKYNIVLEESSRNADLYEGRGDAYVGLKQYDQAVKDYHAAIDLNGSNEELYKKGVKAGLKTGDNKKAMAFIDEMKANVDEEKGEELRKETFVYPAQKALKKKLKALKDAAASNKDVYTLTLQAYDYFDIDGDGVDELLTESASSKSREKNLTIYVYRKGKVKTMLDRGEYGVDTIKVYDKTGSMELHTSGNAIEEYRYYKIKNSSFSKKASGKRRSVSAGAYTNGDWTYYSKGEYDQISKSEYNKIKDSMKKGKARESERSSWKSN